ncbi:NAD(P)/FAD-dependent oxidoreductase [Bradyrhizobium sp. 200]|uniref:flavin-containing monooxygenase n=1 Tax=Bradyrhizobium sp. 200 TaxID=2782665 RepID=UPI001FFEDE00|nr:NAD(P)/FAD-dependent oxidoreductase [Bradyrhizobium sp. 200]UPJ48322.1 NAD(P)/FAD-dependent oxidoreductase [Bradyrhizobium sp. 200]
MTEARKLRVGIIGAGASGIAAAIKMRKVGVDDIVLFEKARDLGGTWRDNSYPGLQCDVPSHLYRFSFAPNPDWSHFFSPGPEIHAYLKTVARVHDVIPLIRYGQEVTRLRYVSGRWQIETSEGDQGEFDVVITATGILHHPVYPDIVGLKDFKSVAFHSSRWDHSVSLNGKRMGIIGTGSTAVQILPAIVDEVTKVSLFQRTAQWILPQPNTPISEEERSKFRAEPQLLQAQYDGVAHVINNVYGNALVGENADFYEQVAQRCRDNLATVRDPDLRARLTPDYKAGCKRLIVSDLFYPAIQRDNAELVTTAIDRIEAGGIRTSDGVLHELDVLVFATGFNPHQLFRPMQVIGRDGRSLNEIWADGNEAYRGVSVPGFPNFFMLGGPNSPIGNFSFIMTAERQLDYVLQLISKLQSGEAREISAKPAPTAAYNASVKEKMAGSIWASGCQSWYIDKNGNVASYPWSYEVFERDMRAPALEDFEIA